jgi:hypothetical protein
MAPLLLFLPIAHSPLPIAYLLNKEKNMKKVSGSLSKMYGSLFAVAVLVFLMPFSAFAAQKLIVNNSTGGTGFVVTDDPRVGIGTSNPQAQLHVDAEDGTNAARGFITSQHYTGTSAAAFNFYRSRGTETSPTALANGDALGIFASYGYDGSNYQLTAAVRSLVKGTVGPNSVPTALWFHTGDNWTDAGAAPRMVIDQTGNIGVATSAPTQKLDVNDTSIRIEQPMTPASSASACNQGQIAWDASYVYVCVATNTWKRSALSSW